MLFRSALRSLAPRALPRVQAPVARSFAASALRASGPEPLIQGQSLVSLPPPLREPSLTPVPPNRSRWKGR